MILIRQTEMVSNAAGSALRQLMGSQSSGAASRLPAPQTPPTARTSTSRPPPPPPPGSGQGPISHPPLPPVGQPPNVQAAPDPTPQQVTPNPQGRWPPVVSARVRGPVKVPPPMPAMVSMSK